MSRAATTLCALAGVWPTASNRTVPSVIAIFPCIEPTPTTSLAKISLSFRGSSSGGLIFVGAAILTASMLLGLLMMHRDRHVQALECAVIDLSHIRRASTPQND